MASLHARHSRSCPLSLAAFEEARDRARAGGTQPPKLPPSVWTVPEAGGCDCTPTYYVAARDERGKLVRERVGKRKRDAERALRKIAVAVDEGAYVPQLNIKFDDWGLRWLEALERKRTTVNSYRSTISYAIEVFGPKLVRRLGAQEVAAFSRALAERQVRRPDGDSGYRVEPLSASTRARHLRVLGACLNSAVRHGYAVRNPVGDLPPAEKPRPQRKESAYFTDDELPRLFAEVTPGLFRGLFELALKTGMRLGELLALTWADSDLTGAVIRVRRTWTDGILGEPKNHERRDVDLTPDVVELLGRWWGDCGRPGDKVLVFPGDDGHMAGTTPLRRELYPALERAGIPRIGPTGEKRTFHSLRHTFARVALEGGAELTWLSRHLGHSSTAVTDEVYGHWSRAARKRAMERLEGAFTV
jgi:integrase